MGSPRSFPYGHDDDGSDSESFGDYYVRTRLMNRLNGVPNDDSDDYLSSASDLSSIPESTLFRRVCTFYTGPTGCSRGIRCTNMHLNEDGTCIRCGEFLRLCDMERHCSGLCPFRVRSTALTSRVALNGQQPRDQRSIADRVSVRNNLNNSSNSSNISSSSDSNISSSNNSNISSSNNSNISSNSNSNNSSSINSNSSSSANSNVSNSINSNISNSINSNISNSINSNISSSINSNISSRNSNISSSSSNSNSSSSSSYANISNSRSNFYKNNNSSNSSRSNYNGNSNFSSSSRSNYNRNSNFYISNSRTIYNNNGNKSYRFNVHSNAGTKKLDGDNNSTKNTFLSSVQSSTATPTAAAAGVKSAWLATTISPEKLWTAPFVCRYFLKGTCRNPNCAYVHVVNGKCVLCGVATGCQTLEQHLKICSEYKTLQEEISRVADAECSICFSKLIEIPRPSPAPNSSAAAATAAAAAVGGGGFGKGGKAGNPSTARKRDGLMPIGLLPKVDRFGLLPDCRHLFCLNCIMSWRKECDESANLDEHLEGRYSCPVCRKKARFVIPCNRVIQTEQRCAREKEIFAHFLRPCRFYKEGKCRAGVSCMWAHVSKEDGLPEIPSSLTPTHSQLRAIMNSALFDNFLVSLPFRLQGMSEDDDDD